MIPRAHVTAWRRHAPWPSDAQVEQDLVISRALVEMFSDPHLAKSVAFRGGTALHKLCVPTPGRYSEDIDLVQVQAGPIGGILGSMRSALDSWLGEPRWKHGHGRVTLLYRFESTSLPVQRMRLKVEINSREHFNVLGMQERRFDVQSRWFEGSAAIRTYDLAELLGTKLRALYQRMKGRDLFDLWWVSEAGRVDLGQVIRCFDHYLEEEGRRVSRAEFEANLEAKLKAPAFTADLAPLLAPGVHWDLDAAARWIRNDIMPRLSGEPWKGSGS